jgi:hypothetical protein
MEIKGPASRNHSANPSLPYPIQNPNLLPITAKLADLDAEQAQN